MLVGISYNIVEVIIPEQGIWTKYVYFSTISQYLFLFRCIVVVLKRNFPLTGYCLVNGINRIKEAFIPGFDSVRSIYVTLKIIPVMNTCKFKQFF